MNTLDYKIVQVLVDASDIIFAKVIFFSSHFPPIAYQQFLPLALLLSLSRKTFAIFTQYHDPASAK